jgi:hypothetical protein
MKVLTVEPFGFTILTVTDAPCINVPFEASLTVVVVVTSEPLE